MQVFRWFTPWLVGAAALSAKCATGNRWIRLERFVFQDSDYVSNDGLRLVYAIEIVSHISVMLTCASGNLEQCRHGTLIHLSV
jgi:hypothetical protein